jgi:hypothetical protein
MDPIISVRNTGEKIFVTHLIGEKTDTKTEEFTYGDIIDMKVNVMSLIEHPEYYAMDTDKRLIVRTDFCNKDKHRLRS